MLKANYTDEEKQHFNEQRQRHEKSYIRARYEILWHHANGLTPLKIAPLVSRYITIVRKVIKDYATKGEASILRYDRHVPRSQLDEHKEEIIEKFTQCPPSTCKEAAARIEADFGVKLSEERVRVYMRKNGFKKLKTGIVPGKANYEEQEEFLKKT